MAITLVGSAEVASNASNNVSGNHVVNVPAGVANGDLLIAVVYKAANATHTLTAPAGWTSASTAQDLANLGASIWYRTASSEPASYTWTISSTGVWGVGQFAFRGVRNGAPHQNNFQTYTTTSPATAPSVTTTIANCVIFTARASRGSSATEVTHSSATAGTEAADWGFDGGATTRNAAAYYSAAQATGSYGYAVTMGGGTVTDGIMFTLALAPAIDGTIAVTGPSPTAAFAGDGQPPSTGTIAVNGPSPTAAFDGLHDVPATGTIAVNGPSPTWVSEGGVNASGDIAVTGPSPTWAADGGLAHGSFAVTGPSPTYTSDGALMHGSFAVTGPSPTFEISGLHYYATVDMVGPSATAYFLGSGPQLKGERTYNIPREAHKRRFVVQRTDSE